MMGDWIHSFIFSAWDNVVGPKVLKVWPTSLFSSPDTQPGVSNGVIDEVGIEIQEEKSFDLTDEPSISASTNRLKNAPVKLDDELIGKYISVHTLTGHLAKSKHTDYDGMNEISLTVPALGFASQSTTFYCLCFSSTENDNNHFCTEEPYMASLSVVFDHGKYQEAFWNLQPLVIHLLSRTVDRLKVGLSQVLNMM